MIAIPLNRKISPNPYADTTSQRGDGPSEQRSTKPLAACSLRRPGYSFRISSDPPLLADIGVCLGFFPGLRVSLKELDVTQS
jgi:hypothetical protein